MKYSEVSHIDLVYKSAKHFKSTANELFKELCSRAAIDIDSPDRNYQLVNKYGKQNEHHLVHRWMFCLHGAEVRFTNIDDDREIEVIIVNGAEFGTLDRYFFQEFCRTTPPYESIATVYQESPEQFEKDMLELLSQGKLKWVNPEINEISRNVTA